MSFSGFSSKKMATVWTVVILAVSWELGYAYRTKPLKKHQFNGKILVIYTLSNTIEVQGTGVYKGKRMSFYLSRHTKIIKYREQSRHRKKRLKIKQLWEKSNVTIIYIITEGRNYIKEILLMD